MDKGKKPIQQEEEEFLSVVNDYHNNNMISSPIPLASLEFSILSDGPELQYVAAGNSPKETTASIVDELDQLDEADFFSKFLSMNDVDFLDPSKEPSASLVDEMDQVDTADFFSKFLSCVDFPDPSMDQYSMLPESNAGVLPIAQADDMAVPVLPISQNLTGRPPPAPAADKDKPLVFRKTMPPHVLAQLAICDPKRAKRIVINRMSAIRAKEKKKMYTCMLEDKMQTLKSKSTELNVQLNSLETEGTTLKSANAILKDQMQIVLEHMQLQDTLNDQIRSEIQNMKTFLGQRIPNLGALIELYRSNSNQNMNAPLGAAPQLPGFQLQNPYPEQQAQFDFHHQQQQPYLGPQHLVVNQCEQGELNQLPQQLYQENPLPNDHLSNGK